MRSQTIKFLIVGVLNTIVGYIVYFLCLRSFDLNYMFSLLIAHTLGVVHSYLWNSKWTFKSGSHTYKNLVKFMGVYVCSFLINLLLLYIMVNYLRINPLFSQVVALFITTVVSFIGHKFWSFKTNKFQKWSVRHVDNK
ncbi:GtrA family protein [Paenibacillus qinlingensis]|uniref:GtrA family protein n=1 Tax=Paenibacillus qinlingensis TaxID=1837343 RepID=UPI001565B980|nr:GtrA family protein [Paenibacillus qinlingensis]